MATVQGAAVTVERLARGETVSAVVRAAGFRWAAVDLAGYRQGSHLARQVAPPASRSASGGHRETASGREG